MRVLGGETGMVIYVRKTTATTAAAAAATTTPRLT